MLRLNVQEITQTLKAFYDLSGISIVLFDYNFEQVLSYPEHRAPLCELFWAHPELRKRCQKCDQNGFRLCGGRNTATVYTCHAGLSEAIMPLKIDDVIVAYVMFGQVYGGDDRRAFEEQIFAVARKSGLPEDVWAKALSEVRDIDGRKLQAAAKVLEALTMYFQANRMVAMGRMEFVESVDGYLAAHLRETIHVADLCAAFGVGRTHLYELMRTHFGCGLGEYIQRYRIGLAAGRLAHSEDSIAKIASDVGYPDAHYFCRVFRRQMGMTAREYRRQHGSSVQK